MKKTLFIIASQFQGTVETDHTGMKQTLFIIASQFQGTLETDHTRMKQTLFIVANLQERVESLCKVESPSSVV